MPVWLEVIIGWIIIGSILNLTAVTVLRKKGYFKWLGNFHDSEAYKRGYEDSKKDSLKKSELVNPTISDSITTSNNVSFFQVREYGINDNRYK